MDGKSTLVKNNESFSKLRCVNLMICIYDGTYTLDYMPNHSLLNYDIISLLRCKTLNVHVCL